jgi:hypothetical protein
MDPQVPGRIIIQRGPGQPRDDFAILPHIYQQASGVVYGVPGGYLKKLVEGEHSDPQLAALNFNHWVNVNKDREILLRFSEGEEEPHVRAMLPASWNPIPYAHMLEALEAKYGGDQKLDIEKFDETALVFNLVTGKLDRKKAKVGDEVEWGMRFADSDVGIGKLELMPYTLTLWCTNGCTSRGGGSSVSISHSSKGSADINEVLANVRQGIEMITGYSRQLVDQMDKAEATILDLENLDRIISRINKQYDVTKLEDRYVREGWDLESNNRPDPTVLRLANSYTRAANAEELKDQSRFKLQSVGGRVLDMCDQGYRWN